MDTLLEYFLDPTTKEMLQDKAYKLDTSADFDAIFSIW